MKVIIIGAGIGGLLTYLSLQKHLSDSLPSLTIKVYESHGSPSSTNSNIGGGLGLAPNGLRAIGSVSLKAARYIQEHGYSGTHFTLRNSTGQLLGHMPAGRPERYNGFGQTLLRRAIIHRALLEEMPEEAVTWGKKVKSVQEQDNGVQVEFEDGEVETADLVIGADGVRSVVREHILDGKFPAAYE
jgi:2-polyprenyl-6-methoxyphenol hydroxylase-like FAD-dependent oxidoreductase